jgi:hypothetical protein
MRTILFLLASFAAHAGAADFRTLDMGANCNSVSALEKAKGSTPVPSGSMEGSKTYGFKGKAFDRKATFAYFCMKGILRAGFINLPDEDLSLTVESLHEMHDRLISTYGTPVTDNTPWPIGDAPKDPKSVTPDSRRYSASWKTERVDVVIVMERSGSVDEEDWWHVHVLYTKHLNESEIH